MDLVGSDEVCILRHHHGVPFLRMVHDASSGSVSGVGSSTRERPHGPAASGVQPGWWGSWRCPTQTVHSAAMNGLHLDGLGREHRTGQQVVGFQLDGRGPSPSLVMPLAINSSITHRPAHATNHGFMAYGRVHRDAGSRVRLFMYPKLLWSALRNGCPGGRLCCDSRLVAPQVSVWEPRSRITASSRSKFFTISRWTVANAIRLFIQRPSTNHFTMPPRHIRAPDIGTRPSILVQLRGTLIPPDILRSRHNDLHHVPKFCSFRFTTSILAQEPSRGKKFIETEQDRIRKEKSG